MNGDNERNVRARWLRRPALLAALLVALGSMLLLAAPLNAQEADTTAPKFVSARTHDAGGVTYVVVTFSEGIALSPLVNYLREKYGIRTYRFPKAVMDVTVDGIDDVLTDHVYVRGSELWLGLTVAVATGQQVRVAYNNMFAYSGGGIFVDASGNPVPFFDYQPVANNSTMSSDSDHTPDYVLSTEDLIIAEGGSATYTVALVSQPSSDVDVAVRAYETLGTSTDLLSFTPENWNTPQTVTVSTYSDADPFPAWGVVHHWVEWVEDGYIATNDDYVLGVRVLVNDTDAPLAVTGPVSTAYEEGGTAPVATYAVAGTGDSTVSWSLLGEDAADFSISASGVLSFNSSPDYESPSDGDSDNVYELFVDADDGSSVGFLPVFVIVTDTDEQSAATGVPSVVGTARVGQTLSVDTSGIGDANGLTNVVYAYQWLADDTEIDGATGSTYTVQSSDMGRTIRVRVDFTDDGGNAESLTSPPSATVTAGGV